MLSTLKSTNNKRIIVDMKVRLEVKAHLKHRMSVFTVIEGVEVEDYPRLVAVVVKV